MRKINTIERYEVKYGESVNIRPSVIRTVIADSGIDAQTYGDADFEEDGLYEFSKESFAGLADWLQEQEDDYFGQFAACTGLPDCSTCKKEIVAAFHTILNANKSDKDVVRIEIY